MALDAAALSLLIRGKLVGKDGVLDNQALTDLCNAIAEAVVEHVTAAATVATVTICPAGEGTGTGTVL